MTPEDAEIARNTRRELGKRTVDSTMIDVQVKAGKITLTGRIAHMADAKGVNLRSEVDFVMKSMTRDRLVKGFFDQLHYVIDHSEVKEEKNARGRMRS